MRQRSRLRLKRRGVPVGYVHKWRYTAGNWSEKKYGRGKWFFIYKNAKYNRKLKSRLGGLPVGSRVVWRINALQTARKVSPSRYNLTMFGKKKLSGLHIAKRRRY